MLRCMFMRRGLGVVALLLLAVGACGRDDDVLYDLTAAHVTHESPVASFVAPRNAGAILTWTCDQRGGYVILRGDRANVRQSLSCDSSGSRKVLLTPGAKYELKLQAAADGTATVAFA